MAEEGQTGGTIYAAQPRPSEGRHGWDGKIHGWYLSKGTTPSRFSGTRLRDGSPGLLRSALLLLLLLTTRCAGRSEFVPPSRSVPTS